MQFHGTADRYTLSGASGVAMLYSSATAATAHPAVTLRSVGTNGGQAAAFTYDLARSIVYTRQGNPAWAGQKRDGQAGPIRSDDLFFGGASSDWVDLSKVAIPQADEQQRLLANLIELVNRDAMPLPRFWYFPDRHEAVVVATGDDHAGGGTGGRFDRYLSAQTPGLLDGRLGVPAVHVVRVPEQPAERRGCGGVPPAGLRGRRARQHGLSELHPCEPGGELHG